VGCSHVDRRKREENVNSSDGIRQLADVRTADSAEVGGTAAGLGELIADGARVPEGFVLPVGNGMREEERRALIAAATDALAPGRYAVRSSGVAEDGKEHSFAGMFETVLDVERADLVAAIERVLGSARGGRATAYAAADGEAAGRMAVIVQRMVDPVAAGVVLTADPVSGDRATTVITAVRGLGERLVSGAAAGDEWIVRDGIARARRRPEQAIDEHQALEIAGEARRIATARGAPQDAEWAIDRDGTLWMLQARPMTALPPEVSWDAPAPGAYSRALRLGEWIGEPVTPLFESWLLSDLEVGLHAFIRGELGQRAPLPHHVIVNGWYFYSLNWIAPGNMLRSLPSILWHVARSPRAVAGVLPATVRFSVPIMERRWRADIQPRYRAGVADAEARVEAAPVRELPALIDEMTALAGEYFGYLVALAGAAYKLEINLAAFHRRHLADAVPGGHLPLLSGLEAPGAPPRHAVTSLDWFHGPAAPTAAEGLTRDGHVRAVEAREAAEAAARAALASTPRRLRAFERLLADAQHIVPIREEQVGEFTLPWPVMRRAVLRIGEALGARGVIGEPEDAFFVTRDEAFAALASQGPAQPVDTHARRRLRDEQARLVPPVMIGHMAAPLRRFWEGYPARFGAQPSAEAIVSGIPASAGRVTASVRIVRRPEEFHTLQPGEVLVAPLTAPAWTPLFARAAAVVTDVGSPAAHASIIAREYGIPAVVGCVDATARLRDGQLVTVDGGTGNVLPA
jgi:pyruvate,water dikinase